MIIVYKFEVGTGLGLSCFYIGSGFSLINLNVIEKQGRIPFALLSCFKTWTFETLNVHLTSYTQRESEVFYCNLNLLHKEIIFPLCDGEIYINLKSERCE